MTQVDQDVLDGLAAKLDGLDLDQTERALLDQVLERAAAYEPEVEGFAFDAALSYTGNRSGAGLGGMSLKLAGGLGFVTRPSLGYEAGIKGTGDFRPPPP